MANIRLAENIINVDAGVNDDDDYSDDDDDSQSSSSSSSSTIGDSYSDDMSDEAAVIHLQATL